MFRPLRWGLATLVALTGGHPGASWAVGDPSIPSGADSLAEYLMAPLRVEGALLPDRHAPFPFVVTRLGPEDVARRPGATLADLLAPVAGVRIASRGVADASVSIRGSTTDQVVFVLDDRRLGSAQGGGFDAATIPLESVETVEVVRGGASAVWGGDAIGGVVRVRTRPPHPGAGFRIAGGSFGERALAADVGFLAGRNWAVRVAGRGHATEGDFSFDDDDDGSRRRLENGELRRGSGEFRAEGDLAGARATVDVSAFGQRRGVPGSEEFPTPSAHLEDRRWAAGLALSSRGGRWRPSLDVSTTLLTRHYHEPEAAFGPIDDSHENRRGRVELGLGHGSDRAGLQAAAGLMTDRLDSTTDGVHRRDAVDARLQLSRDVPAGEHAVRLLGAVRLDAVEGFDPFVSPRVGFASDALPAGARLSASAGLAFRAPSFDELFWPSRATATGNPGLSPEHGRDADVTLGWVARPGGLRVTLGGFVREVRRLIQWVPGADGVWRPHNLGRVRLVGGEGDVGVGLSIGGRERLRLSGSATWLDTEDLGGEPNTDGKELPYRPRWTAAASAVAPSVLGGELEVRLRGLDDVFVTRANTKRLPGHVRVGIAWRRPLPSGFALDATIDNVGDVHARDFRDYPLPGRSIIVGLSWQGGRS